MKLLQKSVRGPMAVGIRYISSKTIAQSIANQHLWNQKLDEDFPCTCSNLIRCGLKDETPRHVCCRFSEIENSPVRLNKMSVKTRTIPEIATVKRELQKSLSSF